MLGWLCGTLIWCFELQATDEDGSGMDDQSLRDELMTFLVAVHLQNSNLVAGE
jgi:cytochrome P450